MAKRKAFILTAKAKSDLRDIGRFTQNRWNRDQRNRYLKQFDDTFHLLAKQPKSGKECDEIRPYYRMFPQGSHIIFYKNSESGTVEIIRILHKHMDPKRWV